MKNASPRFLALLLCCSLLLGLCPAAVTASMQIGMTLIRSRTGA